jgi:hypothetical protein
MKSKFLRLLLFGCLSGFGILCVITNIKSPASHKERSWNAMATEVDSWTDALGMPIDPKIRDTVIVLNLLGFKTSQSCEGHIDRGSAYPWISFNMNDSDARLLVENQRAILEKIESKREELKDKYPDTDPYDSPGVSELIKLREKYREVDTQIQEISRKKMINLKDLLGDFYKKHPMNYDSVLFFSDEVIDSYWLINIGAHWQVARGKDEKLKKLKDYQDEMQLFAQFLKDYYWSSF